MTKRPMLIPNQWVIAPDGRIGQIVILKRHMATIQFGADGPFERYSHHELTCATMAQVEAAGLADIPGVIFHD